LLKTSDVCCENRKYVLIKCLHAKLDIFFLKNAEDVLPEDTGKTLEKIYLASIQ
jgi:hypothetical protein